MMKGEPPSSGSSASPLYLIGQNSRGNWVVQDQSGLRGGLFLDRAQALKFVKSEHSSGQADVITVTSLLELDMSPVSHRQRFSFANAQTGFRRVA